MRNSAMSSLNSLTTDSCCWSPFLKVRRSAFISFCCSLAFEIICRRSSLIPGSVCLSGPSSLGSLLAVECICCGFLLLVRSPTGVSSLADPFDSVLESESRWFNSCNRVGPGGSLMKHRAVMDTRCLSTTSGSLVSPDGIAESLASVAKSSVSLDHDQSPPLKGVGYVTGKDAVHPNHSRDRDQRSQRHNLGPRPMSARLAVCLRLQPVPTMLCPTSLSSLQSVPSHRLRALVDTGE